MAVAVGAALSDHPPEAHGGCMGLLSGAATIRRYAIRGETPPVPSEALIAALRDYRFGNVPVAASDGTEVGFITSRHLFDTDFAMETCTVGDFVHAQLRIDTNRVPADVLRAYVAQQEAAAMEASGRDFLTKQDRKEAKAEAQDRADREAREGRFRRMNSQPFVVDLAIKQVLLGNTGTAVADRFAALYEVAFEHTLEALSSGSLAMHFSDNLQRRRAMEDLRPAHFITPPGEHIADGIGSRTFVHDRDHLGLEFLTWLCHGCDVHGGTFKLAGSGVRECHCAVDASLELLCVYGLSGKTVLRCDAPSSAPELRAALALGKQIKKMGLILAFAGQQFSFTLDGPGLQVSGMKVPDAPDDVPRDDLIALATHRLEAIRDALGVLDRLYEAFLSVRLETAEWASAKAAIQRWIGAAAPTAKAG